MYSNNSNLNCQQKQAFYCTATRTLRYNNKYYTPFCTTLQAKKSLFSLFLITAQLNFLPDLGRLINPNNPPSASNIEQKRPLKNRLQKRVKDGIRTRDPWNHNPMLYPTELLSPLKTISYSYSNRFSSFTASHFLLLF